MPKAIETQIAPAIKAYTNIPGKVGTQSQGGGSYQFHELGPKGDVIDDPEQFASIQAATSPDTGPSYLEYAEKLKAEIGDPFVINVDGEARKLLDTQAPEIFREWSGGQFQLGGYLPPKVKKAWGEYKQRLLGNALKIVNDQKKNKIAEYNQRLAAFKTDKDIKLAEHQEQRLSSPKKSEGIKGALTDSQALERIQSLYPSYNTEGLAKGLNQYLSYLKEESQKENDIGIARLNAYEKTLKWKESQGDGDEEKGLISDPSKQTQAPPKGYKDTGRFSGGKKVYLSPDGKQAWIEP